MIAAHLAAAVWLGGVVAYTSALRRRTRDGTAAPGPVTTRALAAAALFVAASLVWHPLFTPPAIGALIASVALVPAAGILGLLAAIAWRRPPATGTELERRMCLVLAGAWISLTLLLPADFAWVWADRVEWLVF